MVFNQSPRVASAYSPPLVPQLRHELADILIEWLRRRETSAPYVINEALAELSITRTVILQMTSGDVEALRAALLP